MPSVTYLRSYGDYKSTCFRHLLGGGVGGLSALVPPLDPPLIVTTGRIATISVLMSTSTDVHDFNFLRTMTEITY